MMNRIYSKNVIGSYIIGALIGLFSQISLNTSKEITPILVSVLISGMIGLVIGILIELIMSFLPVKIATPGLYFFINNLTALIITLLVVLSMYIYGVENFNKSDLVVVISIASVVIIAANILDFYKYKRTNKKLKNYIEKNR